MPGKLHQVIALGNYTHREVRDWLATLAHQIHWVQGEWDDTVTPFPTVQLMTVGNLRIGALHGHTIVPLDDPETLAAMARQFNVDILVSGATGAVDCYEYEGRLYINPGSATGAGHAPGQPRSNPSFVLLDVIENSATAYVYEWLGKDQDVPGDEVKIVKLEFTKPMECEP
jgi:vacuolar protein sorting-associated protein 29